MPIKCKQRNKFNNGKHILTLLQFYSRRHHRRHHHILIGLFPFHLYLILIPYTHTNIQSFCASHDDACRIWYTVSEITFFILTHKREFISKYVGRVVNWTCIQLFLPFFQTHKRVDKYPIHADVCVYVRCCFLSIVLFYMEEIKWMWAFFLSLFLSFSVVVIYSSLCSFFCLQLLA